MNLLLLLLMFLQHRHEATTNSRKTMDAYKKVKPIAESCWQVLPAAQKIETNYNRLIK